MTRMKKRWGGGGLLLLLVGGLMVLTAAPASAAVTGPCESTVAGHRVRPLSETDPDDAIDVGSDDVVKVAATASSPITSYDVEMEYAGFTWRVAKGDTNGTSWQRDVKVADYARFGVGLYKVRAVSHGVDCTGAALIRITGRSPLTTVAGGGAAAVAAAALVGVVLSLRRSAATGAMMAKDAA